MMSEREKHNNLGTGSSGVGSPDELKALRENLLFAQLPEHDRSLLRNIQKFIERAPGEGIQQARADFQELLELYVERVQALHAVQKTLDVRADAAEKLLGLLREFLTSEEPNARHAALDAMAQLIKGS